ncbi:hypothetical protein OFC37_32440, partial [Escherichia coli]|nr:hypothetical protein [Escherichia coli]
DFKYFDGNIDYNLSFCDENIVKLLTGFNLLDRNTIGDYYIRNQPLDSRTFGADVRTPSLLDCRHIGFADFLASDKGVQSLF